MTIGQLIKHFENVVTKFRENKFDMTESLKTSSIEKPYGHG